MRKVTISLAVSLLVATGAFAGDKYRIFLGAYSGPTVEEMVRDVTPKLKGVEGISDVIAEKRGDKTFVYVNVYEEGESAAKALLPTVKERSGINDAYCLAVKRMAGAKNETKPVKPKERKLDPSFTSVKIEKAKELSEIVGNNKVEEISPITPRPNKEINDNLSEKKKKNLKGGDYNFYQIKKKVEKSDKEDAKDFDALLRARLKAHEQKVQTEKAEAK